MDEGIADGAPANERPPRARSRLTRSMVPVLAALTVAMITVAALIGLTFASERAARARAIRETDALFALQLLLQTVLDAETGQRGYLLTGRAEYLEPYEAARTRTEPQLRRLATLIGAAPDAGPRDRARRLDSLVRTRMATLARTVALARAGRHDAALAVVATGVGRQTMLAIRAEVAWLIGSEERGREASFARVMAVERQAMVLASMLGIVIVALVIVGFRGEGERARIAAEAGQAAALREANEHAGLLTRELNHRVKNLFSVILAIVSLSARKPGSTADVVEDIRARIRSLALAHTVSQGSVSAAEVMLADIVAHTLAPYRDDDPRRIVIAGPSQVMTVRAVTPIGLIVHELATNAAKYGALSVPGGRVEIAWSVDKSGMGTKQLRLTWIERDGPTLSCSPAGPAMMGYGSRMIALAAGQLGGKIERDWPITGAVVRLICPVA